MHESTFKIRERTVVINGPINSVVQTLATVLQEHGTDIAFIDAHASQSQRFVANLMDMRQIHNTYGRAAALEFDVKSSEDAKEALSRAAELFGSVDIFIDANLSNRNFSNKLNSTQLMTNEAIEFFLGRGKGRNIFLSYDNSVLEFLKDQEGLEANKKLHDFTIEKSKCLLGKQITTNCVQIPFTDELVLEQFKGKNIQEVVSEIKKKWPSARMVEPVDIAYMITFLASPISSAIDGQVLHACYGMNNE